VPDKTRRHPLQLLSRASDAAVVLSIAAAITAGMTATPMWQALCLAAASLVAAMRIWLCLAQNQSLRAGGVIDEMRAKGVSQRAHAAHINARSLASVFVWGALAIGAGYGLTELHWQHWWQYALAMLLLAIMTGIIAERGRRGLSSDAELDLLTWVTAIQAVAAMVGLAFLIGSGKLWAGKPDWLANHVFLAGGVAVAAISIIAVWAQRAAKAQPPLNVDENDAAA